GNIVEWDSSGNVVDSGVACCGGSGSGTVTSSPQYQLGYFANTGTTIKGNSNILTDAGSDLLVTTGGVSIGTAAAPTSGTSLDLGKETGSILLPVGTTAQRPATGVAGI